MANGGSSTRIKNNLEKCRDFVSQKLTPVAYYACILLFLILMASILCLRKLQIPFFETKFCKSKETHKFCANLVGYGAVFRIFSAHALFHLGLAIVTSELWLSENWREKMHNDGWGIKVVILSVLVFGSLWIPNGSLVDKILPFIGFLFSFLTILVIMFLLLNIVQNLLDQWIPDLDNLARESWTNSRFLFYLSIISILYLFSTLFFIYCFFLFTNNTTCRCNLIFVSYVFVHSFMISILNPFLQFKNKQSSKAIPKTLSCVFYVSFITWLSMCANPQLECNPYIQDSRHPGIDSNALINIIILLVIICHIMNNPARALAELGKVFTLEYKDNNITLEEQSSEEQNDVQDGQDKKISETQERKTNHYNCMTFHILISLLSLYFMSSATSWHQTNMSVAGQVTYANSKVAMFVLMLATIVCLWVYTWILVKPVSLVFVNWFKKLLFEKNEREAGRKEVINFEHEHSDTANQCPNGLDDLEKQEDERTGKNFNEKKPNLEDLLLESKRKMNDVIEKEKDVSMDEREKEMIRLQEKVLRLQEKICRLQQKVSTLQGVSL